MTGQCKPSEGPWYVHNYSIVADKPQDINHDIFHGFNEPSYDGKFLIAESVVQQENAHLIAEAGTVYHETKLTPRQLLAQRDELLAALNVAKNWGYGQPPDCNEEDLVNTAIANAEKGEI